VNTSKPWWGEFAFDIDEVRAWSLAERRIVVQRTATEWNTWNVEADEQLLLPPVAVTPYKIQNLPDKVVVERYLFRQTGKGLLVKPALADRPVITRPINTLTIMPGEAIRLYISTPLWMQLLTLPGKTCFLDVPFWRPSDSWFGPSTIEGELCYSKHTDARVQLETIEKRPHRAITPVNVLNKSSDPLIIDRINLPVPMLSLFAADDSFWTEAINVNRSADDDTADLHLEKRAPKEAGNTIKVAQPREAVSKRHLIRALSSLFA
jgi:hypothetical protein